jgi:UDP-glucose 4-epimerase
VAGASLDGKLGDCFEPETRLIPKAIKYALKGKKFLIFGKNYKTPDGSCIRDYVHVEDLAVANVLALKRIIRGDKSGTYNLASGWGNSNLKVIRMIEEVSGLKLNTEFAQARPGDPPVVYANIMKAKKELNFKPKYSDLKTIVQTAYKWDVLHTKPTTFRKI